MSSSNVITARVDASLIADLDRLAVRLGRSRASLVARAVESYVKDELTFLAYVQEGIDDVEAGRTSTQDEVEAMFGITPEQRAAA